VVHVEVEPFRQKDNFRRNAGAGVITDLAKRGEVKLGEAVALFSAAGGPDNFAGAGHVPGIDIVAHQLQCEIRLDGPRKVGRPAGKQTPAAHGVLQAAEEVGDFGQVWVIFLFQDEFEQDVFGFQDAVPLEFADPVARGVLFSQ
jgi:hypothetical protein